MIRHSSKSSLANDSSWFSRLTYVFLGVVVGAFFGSVHLAPTPPFAHIAADSSLQTTDSIVLAGPATQLDSEDHLPPPPAAPNAESDVKGSYDFPPLPWTHPEDGDKGDAEAPPTSPLEVRSQVEEGKVTPPKAVKGGEKSADVVGQDDTDTAAPEQTTCKWSEYQQFPPHQVREASAKNTMKMLYTKVPKSGSTTVSCLLHRWADHHGLKTLNPVNRTAYFEDEENIRAAMDEQEMPEPDAFLSHLRYNETMTDIFLTKEMESGEIVPPFRITSIRDPEDRLMSSFFYGLRLQQNGLPGQFVCSEMTDDYNRWVNDCYVRGEVDFMSPVEWDEQDRVDIDKVYNHYDHVFVTDQMVKSILVLAPKLGLTLQEMLVVNMKYGVRDETEGLLPEAEYQDLVEKIKARAVLEKTDKEFYDLSVSKLEEDFLALPPWMRGSLSILEEMTAEVSAYCPKTDGASRPLFDDCISRWIQREVFCEVDDK